MFTSNYFNYIKNNYIFLQLNETFNKVVFFTFKNSSFKQFVSTNLIKKFHLVMMNYLISLSFRALFLEQKHSLLNIFHLMVMKD